MSEMEKRRKRSQNSPRRTPTTHRYSTYTGYMDRGRETEMPEISFLHSLSPDHTCIFSPPLPNIHTLQFMLQ